MTLTFDLDLFLLLTFDLDILTSRDANMAPRMLVRTTLPIGSNVMAQNVIFIVFDVFDLDLQISRSFDFCEFTICLRA